MTQEKPISILKYVQETTLEQGETYDSIVRRDDDKDKEINPPEVVRRYNNLLKNMPDADIKKTGKTLAQLRKLHTELEGLNYEYTSILKYVQKTTLKEGETYASVVKCDENAHPYTVLAEYCRLLDNLSETEISNTKKTVFELKDLRDEYRSAIYAIENELTPEIKEQYARIARCHENATAPEILQAYHNLIEGESGNTVLVEKTGRTRDELKTLFNAYRSTPECLFSLHGAVYEKPTPPSKEISAETNSSQNNQEDKHTSQVASLLNSSVQAKPAFFNFNTCQIL